jgi:hypothetical protein
MYTNLLRAHQRAMQTLIIHGSSGTGKSSIVKQYAKDNNLVYIEQRVSNIEPLNLIVPERDNGTLKYHIASWLKAITSDDCPPTLLFFDEFNRTNNPSVKALFTEMLLDRSFMADYKISDNVMIVGACNFQDEDTNVYDIPDAVLKRATHIIHMPDSAQINTHYKSKFARDFTVEYPNIPTKFNDGSEIISMLSYCPRQFDAACKLWETGVLSESEMQKVFVGKMGYEHGNMFYGQFRDFLKKDKKLLPTKLSINNFDIVSQVEKSGNVIEVSAFLNVQDDKALVAQYLLDYGLPETCQSLRQQYNFDYTFDKDFDIVTQEGKVSSKSWKYLAFQLNKLNLVLK